MPKLNYEESPELEAIFSMWRKNGYLRHTMQTGWRLDVAADLGHSQEYNHLFWKKFRNVVKEANPEALILAEHMAIRKTGCRVISGTAS